MLKGKDQTDKKVRKTNQAVDECSNTEFFVEGSSTLLPQSCISEDMKVEGGCTPDDCFYTQTSAAQWDWSIVVDLDTDEAGWQ